MKVNTDSPPIQVAHAVYWYPALTERRSLIHPTKKAEAIMLTIAILCLVLVPIALDFALRGRHQTIELSLIRQK